MFKRSGQRLLPMPAFLRRVARFAAAAMLLVGLSWIIGILGYRVFEGMSWIDAVLNSAMILTGMGEINSLHTDAGKLFTAFYALFSGIVFLVSIGVLVAPIFHRLLHQFHLETDQDD